MSQQVSAEALASLLEGNESFALIDVREAGEYNSTHIPGSSLIPRRELEFRIAASVPHPGSPIILCDDDGRRAALAAGTLEGLGFSNVSVLERGINRWASLDYPTEWGVNVPSKDFGEKVEVVHHVPEIDAAELHERIERGDKLVILDTRTPEEYQRFAIPGGRSMPGGELALRITDVLNEIDDDTTVILNCAGRTRSITGTRVLQRMGIEALGLKNGTSGWLLAGYELENGADRVELPEVSDEGRAAADEYAAILSAEDGVRYLSPDELADLIARRDTEAVYLVDVRTDKEYTDGHIPGFRWWPGGQAVQRADDLAVVKNSTIVFCCDGRARATVTGSFYRQMGHQEVYAVDGGAPAWAASGRELATGMERSPVAGLGDAFRSVKLVEAQELHDNPPAVTLFVDTSQDFSAGHTPRAKWLSRSWLEIEIGDIAPDKSTPIAVTCATGRNSALAAVALGELGYTSVSVLEGGMAKWREAGLPVEQGLTGIVRPPADINYLGVDRSYGEMMNYLRWETELGFKYATSP